MAKKKAAKKRTVKKSATSRTSVKKKSASSKKRTTKRVSASSTSSSAAKKSASTAAKKKPAQKSTKKKSATKKRVKAKPTSSRSARSSGSTSKKQNDAEAAERQKQRSADYQRRIAAAKREIGPIPEVVDPERREACRYDLKLYLETYTPKAVKLGWSDDHLELIEALQKIILDGGQLAIGMPRGTGKTTIVVRAIMWAISYGHHVSVCFVAATDHKAKKAMKGLRKEFSSNILLLEDFPEICFPIRCLGNINNRQSGQTCEGEPTQIQWGNEELTFPTIKGSAASGARVVAGGITGSVSRGENETTAEGDVIRPSLILIDDPQTRSSAKSGDQVQTILDTIESDIAGMAGPDESVSMLATVTVIYPDDAADQLLDFELNPDWNGIRKKFLLSFPDNMDLWEQYKEIRKQSLRQYRDIRLATAFYQKHRKEMDAGAAVSWEARFRRKTKWVDGKYIDIKEISAIQHAMEWYLVKPDAFASELQNEPKERNSNAKGWLSAKQIAKKVHALGEGVVPQTLFQTRRLISHLDVHEDLLYFAVGALAENGSGGVIHYNTYPEQRSTYFQKKDARKTMQTVHADLGKDGAIRHSLILTAKKLLDRVFIGQDKFTQFQIDLLLIDCGDQWRVVNNVVLELLQEPKYAGRVMMCRGFGIEAGDIPFNERRNPEGSIVGNATLQKPRQKATEAPRLDVDTNYWKEQTNDRLATPLGVTGSLSFYHSDDHQLISEHCKAEFAVKTEGRGRTVYKFSQLPQDNHYYDNVVDLLAGGSFRGCDVPAVSTPVIRRPRRRLRRRSQPLEI